MPVNQLSSMMNIEFWQAMSLLQSHHTDEHKFAQHQADEGGNCIAKGAH